MFEPIMKGASESTEDALREMRRAHADNMEKDRVMHEMTMLILRHLAPTEDLPTMLAALEESMALQKERDLSLEAYHRRECDVIRLRLATVAAEQ